MRPMMMAPKNAMFPFSSDEFVVCFSKSLNPM